MGAFGLDWGGWREGGWSYASAFDWDLVCAGIALGWHPDRVLAEMWPDPAEDEWPRFSHLALLADRQGFSQADLAHAPGPCQLGDQRWLTPGRRAYLWLSDGPAEKSHPLLPPLSRALSAAWDGRQVVVPPRCVPGPGEDSRPKGWELRLVLAAPARPAPAERPGAAAPSRRPCGRVGDARVAGGP